MNFSALPQELKQTGQFCCWRLEEHSGRQTKMPYCPTTGKPAKSNEPDSFAPFDCATQANGYSGIGIGIFDGVCAIDLDNCVTDSGYFTETAADIISLMGSYTEHTPSGNGVHILFRAANVPYDTKRYYVMNHQAGIEVYVAGVTSKYVTVTGEQVNEYPFRDCSAELAILLERYMVRPEVENHAGNAINAENPRQAEEPVVPVAMASSNGQAFAPFVPLVRTGSQLPPFPVDCLPEVLGQYVSAVAENSQTAPDMAAVIGLGVLAVCLQGKYLAEGKPGYREQLSLYAVVIAAPGERKSSVMRSMTKCLYDYEREYNKAHELEIRDNKQQREALERKISGLKKKLERSSDDELELELRDLENQLDELPEKKPARFFADDCSSEALTSLLSNNGGIFSVISTEGGIFDIMAGRYSSKANIDVWLKGHCGDPIRVDRLGREAEYIAHPALSAILSIQPGVLDEIMSNSTMTGRGLIARFLYSSPPSRIGSRSYYTPTIPSSIEKNYRDFIFKLMSVPVEDEPTVLVLSDKAAEVMSEQFQEHERYLAGEGQAIADWASKYMGTVLRIAGLLHGADMEPGQREISVDTVLKAIQIGRYFLAYSCYAYSMMQADLSIQKAKFMLMKMEKNGTTSIKRSDLFQMCRGKFFHKTTELLPTLELLEGHGYVRLEEPVRKTVGRPPDIKVVVNPEVFKM